MKVVVYSKKFIKSLLVQLLLKLEKNETNNTDKKTFLATTEIDLDLLIGDKKCPKYLRDILISYEYIIFDFTEEYENKSELISSIKCILHK